MSSNSFLTTPPHPSLTFAKFDCLHSALNDRFSTSIRDITPPPPPPPFPPFNVGCTFSSVFVVNLFDNFSAFGDSRNRNDFDNVFGLVVIGIGCAFASDVILWITRTPSRTSDRRLNRSSARSAK